MDAITLFVDGHLEPTVFPLRASLAKAVADAGYTVRSCATEASLLQAVGAVATARPLADALQVARSALADGDPEVYLVAHPDAARTRWVRLRDLLGLGLRPSGGGIDDRRLVLDILLYAEERQWAPSHLQVLLDGADETAALDDPRWGSSKDPHHRVHTLRRRLGRRGVWLQRRFARQGEKIDLAREWAVALREHDLPPAEPQVREAPLWVPLALDREDLPDIPATSPLNQFTAGLRRDLGLAPSLGRSKSQGPDYQPTLGALATLVRQYARIGEFFGIDVGDEAWETVPVDAVVMPGAVMADVVRIQRREFLAAVAHYLGARPGITQKRAWGVAMTAIERFQEVIYLEAEARDDGKGLRERVTTMATRAGIAPSTARSMMLKKAPESFERLEYLMNAYGKTLEVRDLRTGELPL